MFLLLWREDGYVVCWSQSAVSSQLSAYIYIYIYNTVNLSLCLTNWALRHDIWGNGCIDTCFLYCSNRGEWWASRPYRFTSGERAPVTHWKGGSVIPGAGLDGMVKWKFLTLLRLELPPPGRPARSQSLYRLRYHGSYLCNATFIFYILLFGIILANYMQYIQGHFLSRISRADYDLSLVAHTTTAV
jgi:hypothetical protein